MLFLYKVRVLALGQENLNPKWEVGLRATAKKHSRIRLVLNVPKLYLKPNPKI